MPVNFALWAHGKKQAAPLISLSPRNETRPSGARCRTLCPPPPGPRSTRKHRESFASRVPRPEIAADVLCFGPMEFLLPATPVLTCVMVFRPRCCQQQLSINSDFIAEYWKPFSRCEETATRPRPAKRARYCPATFPNSRPHFYDGFPPENTPARPRISGKHQTGPRPSTVQGLERFRRPRKTKLFAPARPQPPLKTHNTTSRVRSQPTTRPAPRKTAGGGLVPSPPTRRPGGKAAARPPRPHLVGPPPCATLKPRPRPPQPARCPLKPSPLSRSPG